MTRKGAASVPDRHVLLSGVKSAQQALPSPTSLEQLPQVRNNLLLVNELLRQVQEDLEDPSEDHAGADEAVRAALAREGGELAPAAPPPKRRPAHGKRDGAAPERAGAGTAAAETAEPDDAPVLRRRLAQADSEIAALRGQIARVRAVLDSPASEPCCSFCGEAQHKVQKLVSAGRVFICDGCVGLCNATLARSESAAVSAPPEPAKDSTEHNLNQTILPRDEGQPRIGETRQSIQAPLTVLKGPRRILAALASLRPRALSRAQVALLAGFAPSSGTFSTYLSELRQQHLVEEPGRLLRITEAGVRVLGDQCPQRAATTAELLALWKPRLTGAAKTMLDLVVQAYPQGLSREDLAQRAGLSSSSGTFGTYLSALRTSGLVEDAGRLIQACSTLFPDPPPHADSRAPTAGAGR